MLLNFSKYTEYVFVLNTRQHKFERISTCG